ncbi:MAG: DUF3006 family protein [Bacillus sp. (in: firmicutes)]
MKAGTYTVESIENGSVKVLYRKDESIEEIIPVKAFPYTVKEGDLVSIEAETGELRISYLEKETKDIKAQLKALRDELLNRGK